MNVSCAPHRTPRRYMRLHVTDTTSDLRVAAAAVRIGNHAGEQWLLMDRLLSAISAVDYLTHTDEHAAVSLSLNTSGAVCAVLAAGQIGMDSLA